MLAGLLSHLGFRDRDPREFRGARGATFVIAPGSVLAKQAATVGDGRPSWWRRVGCGPAAWPSVQPEWAERIGAHLVKRSYSEPRWDRRGGRAIATESVTLYGLPIVTGRTVGYDRVDKAVARELFIRHALVLGEWDAEHRFLERNREFVAEVGALEARVRRGHLLDDDAVHDFYDRHIPADVVSARHFDRWWRDASPATPELLELTADDLRDADGAAIHLADYPDTWRSGTLDVPLSYRFAPGEPLDGVTLRVPLTALNQVDEATARLADPRLPERAGPRPRAHAAEGGPPGADPAHRDGARRPAQRLGQPHGRLVDALAAAITEVSGVHVDGERLRRRRRCRRTCGCTCSCSTSDGKAHDADTDLAAIRARLATAAREAIAEAVAARRAHGDHDVGPRDAAADGRGRPRRSPRGRLSRRCSTTTTACRCAS